MATTFKSAKAHSRDVVLDHRCAGFNPAIVRSNGIIECKPLSMNSAIALMTSHNIVESNDIIECKFPSKNEHRTPRGNARQSSTYIACKHPTTAA
jgi:hypothetical protein